jgi:hypothetical protein
MPPNAHFVRAPVEILSLGRTSTKQFSRTFYNFSRTFQHISTYADIQRITLDRGFFVKVKVMINVADFFLSLQLFQRLFLF